MDIERKHTILTEKEEREGAARDFTVYIWTLVMVSSFRYIGRMLMATDDNFLAVVGDIGKVFR